MDDKIDLEAASIGFAAIGSEQRLKVLKILVRAGEGGLTVMEIQARSGIAPSTLSHHLRFLAAGHLIRQEKHGRSIYSTANYDVLRRLSDFIVAECCTDADGHSYQGETSGKSGKKGVHYV